MTRARLDAGLNVPAGALRAQQFYGALYESPIEERLAWQLSKYLTPGVALKPQVTVQTRLGAFRADLVLHTAERNTVIECDGREFHQDAHRDLVRDLALLQTGAIDQIVRFRGTDIHVVLPDVLHVIRVLHPEAFSRRGTVLLHRMTSSPHTLTRQHLMSGRHIVVHDAARGSARVLIATVRANGSAELAQPQAQAIVTLMASEPRLSLQQVMEATR